MEMNSAINTLIFDLDDTLVVEEASAAAAFIEAGAMAETRYGLDPHLLHTTVRTVCREIWYAFSSHPYCKQIGISSWEGMWAEFTGPDSELKPLRDWAPTYRQKSWHTALRRHGIDDADLAAELAENFIRLRRQKHVVYEDTIATLEKLAGCFILGLLTNGASDLQRRKIEGSGIGSYFREILISGDVGFAKPDRRVFELLLSRLGTTATNAFMIGNNLVTDIQAAQQAGLRTIWVHRSGTAPESGIVPDWEISHLNQLDSIMDPLRSR
jgi:putative hydrolase of the HAD superfamily